MTGKRPGIGDWGEFSMPLDTVYAAAEEWQAQLRDVEKPWLCWNISPRWCLLQQNLVKSVGWTPVVGFDPRAGAPPLVAGSILIDFNKHFQWQEMRDLFVIEWVFLFANRLAFWHSDLLCRLTTMQRLARLYDSLRDGEMAAVKENRGLRYTFSPRSKRYWELAACTTRAASRSQFECGAGWWRNFALHANCRDPQERKRREGYWYENGTGIMYWKRHYGGLVKAVDDAEVKEGHCTAIGNKKYVSLSAERTSSNKVFELDLNYDIAAVADRLGIAHLLPPPVSAPKT